MHEATSAPTLRPYQVDALEDVWTAFTRDRHNRVLVKMPTGTGKTVMFAEMLRHYAERWECLLPTYRPNRGARMLVIAHREELLDQAADKISKANRGLMVSIEQGDRYANKYSDVVIASIQTLQAMKFRRLKRLLEQHTFRLVIVDEAHHAAAASYRTALVHLGFLPPADASESEEVEAADFDDVAQGVGRDGAAGPAARRGHGDAEPIGRNRARVCLPNDRLQLRAQGGDRRRLPRPDHAVGRRVGRLARRRQDDGRGLQSEGPRAGGQ
jgi:hypothetical protein